MTRYHRREACIASGHLWRGFDLSGHCFLLIFCNLVMHEEGKAYLGWEKIKDFLRNEEHRRVNDDSNRSDTPLSKLKNEEFLYIRYITHFHWKLLHYLAQFQPSMYFGLFVLLLMICKTSTYSKNVICISKFVFILLKRYFLEVDKKKLFKFRTEYLNIYMSHISLCLQIGVPCANTISEIIILFNGHINDPLGLYASHYCALFSHDD